MSQITGPDATMLRAAMRGRVLGPSDAGYDEARTVWNGEIDRRPVLVAQCLDAADVSAAVRFAQEHGLEIAVRGGAHSTAGMSVVDDGLVVDLSRMRDVVVDPDARRALVGGGATLGDVDAAAQAHGLAVPAGIVSHTGVAGLTLGGGMGWLTRRAGLTVDNLHSVEVVTADGVVRRAAPDENADLFWAVRGGGGNFGVVTRFEFRLHEVGPLVQVAMLFWDLDQGPDVLRLTRELFRGLSPDVAVLLASVNAPPAPFVPPERRLRPCYVMLVTGFGPAAEHAEVADRIRAELAPSFEMAGPMPFLELQRMFDDANAFGVRAYEKGLYLEDLTEEAIAVVTEHVRRKTSPMSGVFFYRLDGAYSEVGDDDTAFGGGRTPRYAVFVIGLSDSSDGLAAERVWVRDFWEAMQPHAMGIGGYVNAEAEVSEDRVRASYGAEKYARLAAVKAEYDPDNVFHHNANILPAPRPPMPRTATD
jgi:FAD/FMN-containing dehydrogenase